MKDIKFLFIGCGAIGKTLIELWNLEKLYKNNKIVIIDPQPMPSWLMESRKNIKHLQLGITEQNANKLLKEIDSNTLVIDVSVEVDSLMIVDICIKKGSMYINTSLEQWHTGSNTTMSKDYNKFKKDTLYYREMLMENKLKTTKSTVIIDHGCNPGILQTFALCCLDFIAFEINKKLNSKEDYANFCKDLKLVSIQVVEYDSQQTDVEVFVDLFVNTWSSLGFQAEGSDHCMIGGPGTYDKSFDKYDLIKPTDGDKNVSFIAEHSMNLKRKSMTVNHKGEPFEYEGMLITHGESNTLSEFLTTADKSYCPSVYYVYRPSDISLECLNNLRKNKYEPLEYWYVLENKDITNKDGFDSIGALLTFEDGSKYWGGSVLSHSDVNKLGFKYAGTATTVQVSASLNSAITWALEHRTAGYNTPEYLNHKEILDNTVKYLGFCGFGWL